jgi:hypothetical protein
MEEDEKMPFWTSFWLVLESIVSIAAILIFSGIFIIMLTWLVIGLIYGKCDAALIQKYYTYIKASYFITVTICIARYLPVLYKKYNKKE